MSDDQKNNDDFNEDGPGVDGDPETEKQQRPHDTVWQHGTPPGVSETDRVAGRRRTKPSHASLGWYYRDSRTARQVTPLS